MTSPRKKETKKQKTIDAAIRLFWNTHDIKKVSIEDVAREAKVSPTTIYNNFGSRDGLIMEVIKHVLTAEYESLRTIIRAEISFPEKIKLFISRKVERAGEADWGGVRELAIQDSRLAKMSEEYLKPAWLEFIRDGKREGYIDPDLSPESIILYLEILEEGARTLPHLFEATQRNTKILPDLMEITFYGFVRRDAKEPEEVSKKARRDDVPQKDK